MFLSSCLVQLALEGLGKTHPFYLISFLSAKKGNLPVGKTVAFEFGAKDRALLEDYYKPAKKSSHYLKASRIGVPGQRWLAYDYPGSGSQKLRTTTFREALLHKHGEDVWGWAPDYLDILEAKLSKRIPAFYLAVWLLRSKEWKSEVRPESIIDEFFTTFKISKEEQQRLFDVAEPEHDCNVLFQEEPISWKEIRKAVGNPPDAPPDEGAVLQSLQLEEIGPASIFAYEPAVRLNILTGDNSLGKTFILESIWWALTGDWLDRPISPRRTARKESPRITYSIGSEDGDSEERVASYSWDSQVWQIPTKRQVLPGLVLYARFDGSFAVWDPARDAQIRSDENRRGPRHVFLSKRELWNGSSVSDRFGSEQWISNGLLRDWVTWQTGGKRYKEHFAALKECLAELSPSKAEPLTPGPPVRAGAFDSREVPTLGMPYGTVPLMVASAGVQRAVALAYVLVWSWYEHLAMSELIRKPPQNTIVMLIDEIEAHLHPRWQRVIVPAVMKAVSALSEFANPQIHIATHSPLVMASSEPIFDESIDDLHHLRLGPNRDVVLEELPFVKRGRVDKWLMSDVFGLADARSLEGEDAIASAKRLQLAESPDQAAVFEVHQRLVKHLAQDDEFWPRWLYFAHQHGIEL